jgi:alanine racemase
MIHLGYNELEIQARLQILRPISMRLEMKQGVRGNYLIDDTYNNDLAGLTIALNFLNQQKQREAKVLILSDLLETGVVESELYKHIAHLVKAKHLDMVIGIGEIITRNCGLFSIPAKNGVHEGALHFSERPKIFLKVGSSKKSKIVLFWSKGHANSASNR